MTKRRSHSRGGTRESRPIVSNLGRAFADRPNLAAESGLNIPEPLGKPLITTASGTIYEPAQAAAMEEAVVPPPPAAHNDRQSASPRYTVAPRAPKPEAPSVQPTSVGGYIGSIGRAMKNLRAMQPMIEAFGEDRRIRLAERPFMHHVASAVLRRHNTTAQDFLKAYRQSPSYNNAVSDSEIRVRKPEVIYRAGRRQFFIKVEDPSILVAEVEPLYRFGLGGAPQHLSLLLGSVADSHSNRYMSAADARSLEAELNEYRPESVLLSPLMPTSPPRGSVEQPPTHLA